MVDSSKFADYIENATRNIEQIKIGLLRHDKNPKDREFLNDISKSLLSISKAAEPLGLDRMMELCEQLGKLLQFIRDEKKELNQEIIITISSCKDRLSKFIFELETYQKERSKTKDLVSAIQGHFNDFQTEGEPVSEEEIQPAPEDLSAQKETPEDTLLPDEVINEDYDKELFQIFIEQLQDSISLLRSLTDSYPDAPNQDAVMNQCSDLIGKLQSSANYMGYDKLAEYYLQWIAELEMIGVELSMGTPVSFDFMDQKIKEIVNLFPQIEDKPADPEKLKKTKRISQPTEEEIKKEKEPEEAEELQEIFSSMDETGTEENLDDGIEPIAALSGETVPGDKEITEKEPEEGQKLKPIQKKKESRITKTIEIDSSFLEEEKESGEFDEELFQIFIDQLQENISQLQELTDSFTSEPNKSKIIDQCSNLVGKLQSSANYMGYERLAEYYLQWIAELEMSGVELSIGSDVSFDFMQEKILRITNLFLSPEDTEKKPSPAETALPPEPSPDLQKEPPQEVEEEEPLAEGIEPIAGISEETVEDHPLPQTDMYEEEDEEEEEPLGEGVEPRAALADEEPGEKIEEKGGEFSDAVIAKLETFFADIEEPEDEDEMESSFMEIASLSDEESEEPQETIGEPIAGLSEEATEEQTAALFEEKEGAGKAEDEGGIFGDAVAEKFDSFFADFEDEKGDEVPESPLVEAAPPSDEITEDIKEPAGVTPESPAPPDEMGGLFEEEPEEESLAEGVEPIAGTEEPIPASLEEPKAERVEEGEGEFSDAVAEKLESFFAEIEEPQGEDELESSFMEIASLSDEKIEPTDETSAALIEEEPVAETKEEAASPVAGEMLEDIEAFFEEETTEKESTKISPEPSVPDKEETELFEAEELTAALFEEEPEVEEEEQTAGPVAGEMLEDIEAFFDEGTAAQAEEPAGEETTPDSIPVSEEAEEVPEGLEEHPAEEIPREEEPEPEAPALETVPEDIETIFAEEQVEKEVEQPSDELDVDIDTLMTEEELPDESIKFYETEYGDEKEEELTKPTTDELLSDEELLQEIEGPTVGEELSEAEAESLLPEIEVAEEVVSSLPEGEVSEEELFKKLEEAISSEQEQPETNEDLTNEEEISDDLALTGETTETQPERKELFKKLTHALQSLDEETGDIEEVEEIEEPEPEPVQEFDSQLFDKLTSALETPSEFADITGTKPIDHVLEEILSSTPVEPQRFSPTEKSIPKKLASTEIKQIISMDSDKVDQLMDQLGELNTNKSTLSNLFAEMNELHHHYQEIEGLNKHELKPLKDLIYKLGDTSLSLNRLSNEIREGVLKVRMVPIGLLFERYHDFVRELAAASGKQVEIEITGEDTELEKIVVDEIAEPLTHIISNTVEHGIETVEKRKELGKKEVGTIRLDAYHDNHDLVIEIMDDGQGIDLKKVKAKALEKGLFTGDELYKMSEKDLKRLILNPDFSTVADEDRKPEDRGEGLYIANTHIEKLKGSIDVRSTDGKGTIIQVRIPLNLLVIKALKVKAGNEIMALPVNNIEAILKFNSYDITDKDGKKRDYVPDTNMPLLELTEAFDIEPAERRGENVYVIIVEAEKQSVGLIVDETAGLEEIVIKPLGEFLRKESGFSGATIINDGNISLIPDTTALIRIANEQIVSHEETVT